LGKDEQKIGGFKMSGRQKTCEERIDQELKRRIHDFELALDGKFKELTGDSPSEEYDFVDWINEYALAYSDDPYYRGKRLELSYGGPQDYFVFHENGQITYHFLDWFDGAKRPLFGYDLEIMEQVRDWLGDY